MKKGLVVIYDPHSLQQFLWYYCTHAYDVKWDALCLPNGYKGTYMDDYCKKADIFNKVITSNVDYMNMPLVSKFFIFLQMVWYFITFRREKLCKKILNDYVDNIDEYEELACICESGFVSGLFALLGKHIKVSYFDDGLGDYHPRQRWKSPYLKSWPIFFQGLVMAKMGYGCKGRFYFEPTKYCYKYSAITDKMSYRNYKEMIDIDFRDTNMELYDSIIERVYPKINEIEWEKFDTVFFTEDLDCFSPENFNEYGKRYVDYLSKKTNTLLIKKHPKDSMDYEFDNSKKIFEVDSDIPAEILLSYMKEKKIVFSFFSSVILFMQPYGYEFEIMYIEELHNDNLKSKNAESTYGSIDDIRKMCDRFTTGKYTITKI